MRASEAVSVPPPTPSEVLADLGADEPVFRTSAVRVATSPGPGSARSFGGVAVLTSNRIAIVPGAPGSPSRKPVDLSDLPDVISDLWSLVKPVVLDAFPVIRLLTSDRPGKSHLAARSRPGIEIPVHLIRRAFESHVPTWIGIELALPMPDPRPPFCLYLELVDDRDAPRKWCELIEAGRRDAHPAPELERPFALYYLLRDLPKPRVRARGPDGARSGVMAFGPDGIVIGGSQPLRVPFESVTELTWASPSAWRRGEIHIVTGERTWVVEPVAARDIQPVRDLAHLLGEVTGVPLRDAPGHLRTARIAAWATAAGTATAAIVYELIHLLG